MISTDDPDEQSDAGKSPIKLEGLDRIEQICQLLKNLLEENERKQEEWKAKMLKDVIEV